MKILTVVGARPQFIKAAAISRELRKRAAVSEILTHTGQHYDDEMSGQFFQELAIPSPDHHLGVGSGFHGNQTGRMLIGLEPILQKEQPDWVLVYGDTNSTLAGALTAAKLHIPVAHVEAGLRSFNRKMPEEINRVLADHVSQALYAPTSAAVENLLREGVPAERIVQVGDVMYDVALFHQKEAADPALLRPLGLKSKGFVLATIHRAENTDDPERLRILLEGLTRVSATLPVVLPLHPRTAHCLSRLNPPFSRSESSQSLHLLKPVGYLDMIRLERSAAVIATDSGGVQKEAFFHGTPCVTLRDETEWVELVELGANRLCPPRDAQQICRTVLDSIGTTWQPSPVYGDGQTARRIVDHLLNVPLVGSPSLPSTA